MPTLPCHYTCWGYGKYMLAVVFLVARTSSSLDRHILLQCREIGYIAIPLSTESEVVGFIPPCGIILAAGKYMVVTSVRNTSAGCPDKFAVCDVDSTIVE